MWWWFLCNVCYERNFQSREGARRRFFVTSCLHVLCEQCVGRDQSVCKKCGQKSSIVPINSKTPDSVKELFVDDLEPKIRKLYMIHSLQHKQRSNIMNAYQMLFKRFGMAKQTVHKAEKDMKIILQKYNNLKNLIPKKDEQISLLTKRLQSYAKEISKKSSLECTPYGSSYGNPRQQMGTFTPRSMPSALMTPDSIPYSATQSGLYPLSSFSMENPFIQGSQSGRLGKGTPFRPD